MAITSSTSGFYAFVAPALLGALLIGLLRPGRRVPGAAPTGTPAGADSPLAP
ncbi:hypothetical protein [Streptomyces sp. NPDC059759]|uniref:hypothetical protein n=1 Tax=unclassified Streptomyces TaxID=2593676 RepID=UPI0036664361